MAALQNPTPGLNTNTAMTMSRHGSWKVDVASDEFPKGLRVLVVDDDITTLTVVEGMLRKSLYLVTTCSHAMTALNLLRERKGCYDVVVSDVHMPDMDGFSLLEFIDLEMDLPVIMMSVDEDTRTVMKGIRHGACDYLIKPVREEELKNIWQHVVRRKIERKKTEYSGSLEDSDRHRRGSDSAEHTSSVNEGADVTLKAPKRKGITEGDDGELLNDDQTTSKKPRVAWSMDLHEQFVHAVRHLGVEKAVPKRILEMMNVPGLTRENVASHLQKFRLHLKRLSMTAYPGGAIPRLVGGPIDSNMKTLAASGQIPHQTLAALHAELYGHLGGGAVFPTASQQAPLGPNVDPRLPFTKPLVKCQPNLPCIYPQAVFPLGDLSLRLGTLSAGNPSGLNANPSDVALTDILHLQNQPQQQHQGDDLISVQPSCLMSLSQSSGGYQVGNYPTSGDQNNSFNQSTSSDHTLLSPQPFSPFGDLDFFHDGRVDIPNDAMSFFNEWNI